LAVEGEEHSFLKLRGSITVCERENSRGDGLSHKSVGSYAQGKKYPTKLILDTVMGHLGRVGGYVMIGTGGG